jgi:hypothetical protein
VGTSGAEIFLGQPGQLTYGFAPAPVNYGGFFPGSMPFPGTVFPGGSSSFLIVGIPTAPNYSGFSSANPAPMPFYLPAAANPPVQLAPLPLPTTATMSFYPQPQQTAPPLLATAQPRANELTLEEGRGYISNTIANYNTEYTTGAYQVSPYLGERFKISLLNGTGYVTRVEVKEYDAYAPKFDWAAFDPLSGVWSAHRRVMSISFNYTIQNLTSGNIAKFSISQVQNSKPAIVPERKPAAAPSEEMGLALDVSAGQDLPAAGTHLDAFVEKMINAKFNLIPDLNQRFSELPLTSTLINVPGMARFAKLPLNDLIQTLQDPPYDLKVVKADLAIESTQGLSSVDISFSEHEEALQLLRNTGLLDDQSLVSAFIPKGTGISDRPLLILKRWSSQELILKHFIQFMVTTRAKYLNNVMLPPEDNLRLKLTVEKTKSGWRTLSQNRPADGVVNLEFGQKVLTQLRRELASLKSGMAVLDAAWFLYYYAEILDPSIDKKTQFKKALPTFLALMEFGAQFRKMKPISLFGQTLALYPQDFRTEFSALNAALIDGAGIRLAAAAKMMTHLGANTKFEISIER